jgi:nitrate/TMAO reductase-like tetraheme cytochrome c subunit
MFGIRLPGVVHNRLSYGGAVLAGLSFTVFVFLVILHTVGGAGRAPYAGIVIFVVVPAFLLLGLGASALGMVLEWRRRRRTGRASFERLPVIDLGNPRHRNALFLFSFVSLVLLFCTVFGSYQVYEVTESVQFCGQTCHVPMKPEYTTYEHSPHARVACVDCHVGPGADWYVRSKLSGAYQVYAVLFDKFPRPIPAPIKSLRPAQETCEQCHWPKQFYGSQQREIVHFLSDEKNTRWTIELLVKIGGNNPVSGPNEGIHWHMTAESKVEYVATDPQRQVIPWVRTTNRTTGEVVEYVSTKDPPSPEELARAQIRTMDCMDCHNRPTHILPSPSRSVNLALEAGRIDPSLPFIKRTAVQLLAAEYPSQAAALGAIEKGIVESLDGDHPGLLEEKKEAIAQAVSETQAIYRRSFFPDMNVRWDTYADNIGHFLFAGCGRCHDGLHRSSAGAVVSNECTTCHSILSQGGAEERSYARSMQGLEFQHPLDIGGAWRFMKCSGCHTGALP